MKFTYTFTKIFIFFSVLLVCGILFSSKMILCLSIFPFLLIMVGILLEQPNNITINRITTKENITTNTIFTNKIDISISTGIGLVSVVDLLPPNFELINGSNYALIWKGISPVSFTLSYDIRSANSGIFKLNSFFYESHHFLEFLKPLEKRIRTSQTLTFSPLLIEFKKLKNIPTVSDIFNYQFTKSPLGIPTMEFKQLKNYTMGDPFKFINWKATSRNISSNGKSHPVINEFEKEGNYNIWMFLDLSNSMLYGTNIKNVLNYALDALLNLSDYYIQNNANVAFSTFNGNDNFLYPGNGKNQYLKLLKMTLQLGSNTKSYSKLGKNPYLNLKETIYKYRKYFVGSHPFFIVLTRITPSNINQISIGLKELFKYITPTKRKLPIILININGHILSPEPSDSEKLCINFFKTRDKYLIEPSLKNKLIWIDWDPFKSDFYSTLLHELKNF